MNRREMFRRRVPRMLIGIGALAGAGLVLLAPGASAKSTVQLDVSGRGDAVRLVASGGTDTAGLLDRVCIQRQEPGTHGHRTVWRSLVCSGRMTSDPAVARFRCAGSEHRPADYRAVLYVSDPGGRHLRPQTTAPRRLSC